MKIALECAALQGCNGEIAVIGGAEIFREMLPLADRIELTRVHASPQGDTFFPRLDQGEWIETSCERHSAGPKDDADYSFIRLERRHPRGAGGFKT